MKIAIITSKKDPAGLNIHEALKSYTLALYEVEKESINEEDIDKIIKADVFIFATKHESEQKIPTLSLHTPGNWNKAELGGKERTLCISYASLIKELFLELNKQTTQNYQCSLEQTHHGPYLEKPCLFIEIGSSQKEWEDKKASAIIVKTLNNVLKKPIPKYETTIILGGGHYNQLTNKILLRTDIAVSHICAKYDLINLNKELILQAINKTVEKVDYITLDWKGLGLHKQKVTNLLKELNLDYKRSEEILKV